MRPPTILLQNDIENLDKGWKEFQYCSNNHIVNISNFTHTVYARTIRKWLLRDPFF